jgi:thiosulfate/3-mercaptopyruvate sulfurtransferase
VANAGNVALRQPGLSTGRPGNSHRHGRVIHSSTEVTHNDLAHLARLVNPLIEAGQLADLLAGGRPPVLLDVRWRLGGPPGLDSYLAGHLPGAKFIDLDTDLAGPPGRAGRHPLPDQATFSHAMRRAGVSGDRTVVGYDDGDCVAAARLWWLLRYFGHQDVLVLDGGYAAWAAAGQPVSTDAAPQTLAGDFTAAPGGMPVLDSDGAAALAKAGWLIDARAAARYRGEVEPIDPVAGHIPGAISAPATGNIGADGRFLPPARLRERYAALGLPTGPGGAARAATGAYCGSGVTAAQTVLALELIGLPAALYVGSWSAWTAEPGRPVATGPRPE